MYIVNTDCAVFIARKNCASNSLFRKRVSSTLLGEWLCTALTLSLEDFDSLLNNDTPKQFKKARKDKTKQN